MATERICVGAIAGAFGVRGEVRLKSFCAEPEAIAGYSPLWTEDGTRSFAVRITRTLNGALAARLTGIDTKDEADALRGTQLFTDRAKLPNLPDDEFYHADLIGLTVLDAGGATLGTVRAVHNHGAGDILEVYQPGRKTALLLPFTREIVPTVDLKAGRIIADPPVESEE
jgi:16S rRNA processing protein RimM